MITASRNPLAINLSCERDSGSFWIYYSDFHEGQRGCIQATSCVRVFIIGSVSDCPTMARASFLELRSNIEAFLSLDRAMGDQQCH